MFDDEQWLEIVSSQYGLNLDGLSSFCREALVDYLKDSIPDEPEFIPGLWIINAEEMI